MTCFLPLSHQNQLKPRQYQGRESLAPVRDHELGAATARSIEAACDIGSHAYHPESQVKAYTTEEYLRSPSSWPATKGLNGSDIANLYALHGLHTANASFETRQSYAQAMKQIGPDWRHCYAAVKFRLELSADGVTPRQRGYTLEGVAYPLFNGTLEPIHFQAVRHLSVFPGDHIEVSIRTAYGNAWKEEPLPTNMASDLGY